MFVTGGGRAGGGGTSRSRSRSQAIVMSSTTSVQASASDGCWEQPARAVALVSVIKPEKVQPRFRATPRPVAHEGRGRDRVLDVTDGDCGVCGSGDDSEAFGRGDILFCDGCERAFHQQCYCVAEVPEGDWFCRICEANGANSVGGAVEVTGEGSGEGEGEAGGEAGGSAASRPAVGGHPMPLFTVGDVVEGRFRENDAWYLGTVTDVTTEPVRYAIEYHDGDSEEGLAANRVRAPRGKDGVPGSGPAPDAVDGSVIDHLVALSMNGTDAEKAAPVVALFNTLAETSDGDGQGQGQGQGQTAYGAQSGVDNFLMVLAFLDRFNCPSVPHERLAAALADPDGCDKERQPVLSAVVTNLIKHAIALPKANNFRLTPYVWGGSGDGGGGGGGDGGAVDEYNHVSLLQEWETQLGKVLRRLDEEEHGGDLTGLYGDGEGTGSGEGGGMVEGETEGMVEGEDEGCCAVCGGGTIVTFDTPVGEQVLLCDGCDAKVHFKCAGITEVPEGDWFCTTCTSKREGEGEGAAVGESATEDTTEGALEHAAEGSAAANSVVEIAGADAGAGTSVGAETGGTKRGGYLGMDLRGRVGILRRLCDAAMSWPSANLKSLVKTLEKEAPEQVGWRPTPYTITALRHLLYQPFHPSSSCRAAARHAHRLRLSKSELLVPRGQHRFLSLMPLAPRGGGGG